MAMDPRTHPRGAPPDFSMAGLPANPNPSRITNALWWLRCMRLRLEPLSADGGILALKPGYHSYGSRLVDYGQGDSRTDHSIRRATDRTGSWWQGYAAAHDWTFTRAHQGNFTEIDKYTSRLVEAMRSLTDLRPDDVYAYTIGQTDNDRTVEGWNEYNDTTETGDESHLWHRHDSFRRNIVGSFPHMWKALTIDMGWTYDEWLRSITPAPTTGGTVTQANVTGFSDAADAELEREATEGVLGYKGGGLPVGVLPPGSNFLNFFTKLFNDTAAQDAEVDSTLAAIGNGVVATQAMVASIVTMPQDMEQHPLLPLLRYALANPQAPEAPPTAP